MVPIAAHHSPVSDQSLGRNLLVTRFIRCIRRLRPPVHPRMPNLGFGCGFRGPFESSFWTPGRGSFVISYSQDCISISHLFLEESRWLQALSVAPSCLEFVPGMARAFWFPRLGYVPKVPSVIPWPVILQAFCPPPFRDADQEKLKCMYPVRALDTYVHRAALWRKSDQLFVCYGPYKKALPANKQTLSRWIVDAITTAYESSDFPSPLGVRVHSTRGMAASKAFSSGLLMHNICNAVGWSTPLTYVRFYILDLETLSSFCRSTLGRDLAVWWHEPDSNWCAEGGFNDGRVERFQQLLWQAALPQLAKEVQPLLGLFYNGVFVIVPLQVLGDGAAQEPEWIHCSHSAVHNGKWGESRGVSPEVHDHLHCFEHVILQVVKTATDSQLLNLRSVSRSWMRPISVVSSANFGSLTKGSLDVQSFVYREKSSGERTQSWGAPVLIVWVLDENFPSLTSCACLSVWSTDRRRWGRRAVSVLAGGGLGW